MKFSELRNILEKADSYSKRHGSDHDLYYSPKQGKFFLWAGTSRKKCQKGH